MATAHVGIFQFAGSRFFKTFGRSLFGFHFRHGLLLKSVRKSAEI
jgi:hypothetical protein